MRRGQSAVEVVCAITLLSLLLSACGLAALMTWRAAEVEVARLAAARASSRGGDPLQAASDAVPPLVQAAVRQELSHGR
jgi:hypothetical protein